MQSNKIGKFSLFDGIEDLDLNVLLHLNTSSLALAAISCVNTYYAKLTKTDCLSQKIKFFDSNNLFVHNKEKNPENHVRNKIGKWGVHHISSRRYLLNSTANFIPRKLAIIGGPPSDRESIMEFIANLNRANLKKQRTKPEGCKIYWDAKLLKVTKKNHTKFFETAEIKWRVSRLNAADAAIILIDINANNYDEKKLTRLINVRSQALFPKIHSDAPIFLVGTKVDSVNDSSRITLLKEMAKKYDFINGCLAISLSEKINCKGLFFELEKYLLEKEQADNEISPAKKV